MKKYFYLAACLAMLLSSCTQYDKFTGLWNKEKDSARDAAAFPLWAEKGRQLTDTARVASPLFVRVTKEMGYYVLRCYQLDAAQEKVVAETSIFDFVKFKKTDEKTLISDNKASNILTPKQIILQVGADGRMTMRFPIDEQDMPGDKRVKALFQTVFNSGFNKLLDIRRKTDDPELVDKKLRDSKYINHP